MFMKGNEKKDKTVKAAAKNSTIRSEPKTRPFGVLQSSSHHWHKLMKLLLKQSKRKLNINSEQSTTLVPSPNVHFKILFYVVGDRIQQYYVIRQATPRETKS